MKKVVVNIEGMSCQHCVIRVKKSLDRLEGILWSDVKVGSAIIEFDDSQLNEKDLQETIRKAGYQATVEYSNH